MWLPSGAGKVWGRFYGQAGVAVAGLKRKHFRRASINYWCKSHACRKGRVDIGVLDLSDAPVFRGP